MRFGFKLLLKKPMKVDKAIVCLLRVQCSSLGSLVSGSAVCLKECYSAFCSLALLTIDNFTCTVMSYGYGRF